MEFNEVKMEIAKMRSEGKSYKYIGDLYGVNKGMIYFIVNNNHEPTNKKIRKKLGLDETTVNFIKHIRGPKGTFIKDE